jgi:phage host-nuclease inhibitor protein Gam
MAINEIEILAEALDEGEELEFQQQGPERFKVDNLDKLDWAIRKWGRIDREVQQKVDCAKRQIERLQAYIKDTQEKADREKASLELVMEPFVRRQLEGGKAKTFKAPSGSVQIKAQQPEIKRDDETLLQFLHESDLNEYIKTIEKPDWAGLKKRLATQTREDGSVVFMTPDGEIAEGVAGQTRPDKVVVEAY